jgi:PAS domain S-box-containing protein
MSLQKSTIDDQDFRTLADSLPDFIGRYDINGRIRYLNKQLRQALGITMEQALGFHNRELWPDGRFDVYTKKIAQCAATGNSDYLDLTVPDFNGKLEYHHIRFVAERNHNNDIVGVIAFGRDMTERILLEQKLTSSTRLAGLGQMAGGVAHEINTPLGLINLLSQQLLEQQENGTLDPSNLKKSLTVINETVDRISKIIQGLKMFSRDGSQDSFSKLSVDHVVESSLALCSEKLKSKKIDLQLDMTPQPLYFRGKEVEVSQVFYNLLNNAYDAVESMEKPWIKIESKDLGDLIQLSVSDSGAGIPADIRTRIMEPFFTTKPIGQGTGIGLSVSKGIIEMHGGQLKLDNSADNTCFVMTLPKHKD